MLACTYERRDRNRDRRSCARSRRLHGRPRAARHRPPDGRPLHVPRPHGPRERRGCSVRPHPHINLATVTYLFDGAIVHRDSLGSHQTITPGAINWMNAGKGIAHSERIARDGTVKPLHGLQLWVALPAAVEESAPFFEHTPASALPSLVEGGATMRVLCGTAFGGSSPVRVASPMFYVDVVLAPGARIRTARRVHRARDLRDRGCGLERRVALRYASHGGVQRGLEPDADRRGSDATRAARRRASRRAALHLGGTSCRRRRRASRRWPRSGVPASGPRCLATRSSSPPPRGPAVLRRIAPARRDVRSR